MTANVKVVYNRFSDHDGYGYSMVTLVKCPYASKLGQWVVLNTKVIKCDFSSGFERNPKFVYVKAQTLDTIVKFLGSTKFFGGSKYFTVSEKSQWRMFKSTLAPYEF